MTPLPLLLLALMPPTFAPGLRYTVNGLHPHPVTVPDNAVPHTCHLAWLLPEPTPAPPEMDLSMEQPAPNRAPVANPACDVPDGYEPDHHTWLVLPVVIDVRDWGVDRAEPVPFMFPLDQRQAFFTYLLNTVNALNNVLTEAGYFFQVVHINMHDESWDSPETWTTAQVEQFWTPEKRAEYMPDGGLLLMVDGYNSDSGWWSDYGSCGGTMQTGLRWDVLQTTPLSNGPADENVTHESLHALWVAHAPVCGKDTCWPGAWDGTCPAEADLVGTSYCGDFGCSVYHWELQQFTDYFVRISRYRQEAQPCFQRVPGAWPPPRVPQCAAPTAADASAAALLLPLVGLIALRSWT